MTLWTGQPGCALGARRSRQGSCPYALGATPRVSRRDWALPAFTLIELILVMALLTVVISLTAPKLSRFFHGRTLDSEARRLLALTRSGQSRAVSEGLPMDLWVDAEKGEFGLEAEHSFETSDPKAMEFTLDSRLKIEAVSRTVIAPVNTFSRSRQVTVASIPRAAPVRSELPTIRFLPDGSLGEASPQKLHLSSADGDSLWLAQASDGLSYEIRSADKDDGAGLQTAGALNR